MELYSYTKQTLNEQPIECKEPASSMQVGSQDFDTLKYIDLMQLMS